MNRWTVWLGAACLAAGLLSCPKAGPPAGGGSEQAIAAALSDLAHGLEGAGEPSVDSAKRLISGAAGMRLVATAGDGTVWGEIGAGGPRVGILTQAPPAGFYQPAIGQADAPAAPPPEPAAAYAPETKAATSVPKAPNVLLMSALDSGLFKDPSPKLKAILQKEARGYTNVVVKPATVENLAAARGYGVLIFKGHGLEGANTAPGDPEKNYFDSYTLSTSTRVDLKNPKPAAYKDDIDALNVVYVYVPTAAGATSDGRKWEWVFGVNLGFVDKYWDFEPGSLVMINACKSGATEASDFFSLLLGKKHVAAYLGWDSWVDTDFADDSAKFVVDRLVGANSGTPRATTMKPPQRPFDLDEVMKELPSVNLLTWPGVAGKFPPATLALAYGGDRSFGVLAPSIRSLEVDEEEKRLTIRGLFGVQDGRTLKVTIGGQEAVYKQWDEKVIVTELLPEQSGEVVVEINGRKSNPVKLTEWHVVFQYDVAVSLGAAGGVQKTMKFDLRFRADVHGYRDTSGQKEPAHPSTLPFIAESSSTVTYGGTGALNFGMGPVRLSGGGTITRFVKMSEATDLPAGDYYDCEGYIDLDQMRLVIYLDAAGYGLTWSDGGTDSVEFDTSDLATVYGSWTGVGYGHGLAYSIPLDAAYAILGATPTDSQSGVDLAFAWSTTPGTAAPLETDPR